MKKTILIVCAVMLLFSGCVVQESPDSTNGTAQIDEAKPGLYIPQSDVELQTNGAVYQFALDGSAPGNIYMMGERLVVLGGSDQVVITAYSGDRAVETASVQLPVSIDAIEFISYHNGCAYYLASTREFAFLDMQLSEVNRIQIPDGIYGKPVLSNDGSQIFYCIGQQLYAIDVQRNITRLIKNHECKTMELLNCYMNGTVLACRVEYETAQVSVLYIDGETGQTLYDYDQIQELYSYENRFYGRRIDGSVEQRFFGEGNELIQQINGLDGNFAMALELNALIRYNKMEDGSLQLQLLDLAEGKITSQIALRGVDTPIGFAANRWKNWVWLLAKGTDGQITLLRWNVKNSATVDETVYTGQFFTATNPDTEGLDQCSERAKKMGKSYGVQIRLWEHAVKYPGDYVLEPEHQTAVINQCLDQLEVVLKEYPKKFLDNAVSNQIRVCIVRSVDGETKAVRYWNGSSAYIILSVGCDVRNGFIKGLSYVVDSHVLGNSSRYDYWTAENPEGFSYADKSTHSKSHLKGDKRAFVDELSMTSVVEDRSAIFYEAMQPDNQSMFKSEAMQNKLYILCKAVRSAWKLSKSEEVFPWEQYLDNPIAKK